MPLTPNAIEKFISARVTAVTECNVVDLSQEFPTSEHWVSGLGLMIIFTDQPKTELRPFALHLVRRSEMTLINYQHAHTALQDLVSKGPGRWSPYYRALSYLEASVAHLYQAYMNMHKLLGTALFSKSDGSPLQRLNHIYNVSKHETPSEEDIIWITNTGLATKEAAISFAELEELMRVCARIAKRLSETT